MRIIIADDHTLVRTGLKNVLISLSQDIEVIECGTYAETIAHTKNSACIDILFLDLMMPGMDGFSGVRELCQQLIDVSVVVVSAKEQPSDVAQAIECGAMGYIPKSLSSEVLKNALRLVLSGSMYLPPHLVSRTGDGTVNAGDKPLDMLTGVVRQPLPPRLQDVLELIVQGQSNKQIAARLGLADATVKVHVARLLRALNVRSRRDAARLGERIGSLQ